MMYLFIDYVKAAYKIQIHTYIEKHTKKQNTGTLRFANTGNILNKKYFRL